MLKCLSILKFNYKKQFILICYFKDNIYIDDNVNAESGGRGQYENF